MRRLIRVMRRHDLTKTSQELRMLSSVTINCQVSKIVIDPGFQYCNQFLKYHYSLVPMIAPFGCSLMEVHRKVGRQVGR